MVLVSTFFLCHKTSLAINSATRKKWTSYLSWTIWTFFECVLLFFIRKLFCFQPICPVRGNQEREDKDKGNDQQGHWAANSLPNEGSTRAINGYDRKRDETRFIQHMDRRHAVLADSCTLWCLTPSRHHRPHFIIPFELKNRILILLAAVPISCASFFFLGSESDGNQSLVLKLGVTLTLPTHNDSTLGTSYARPSPFLAQSPSVDKIPIKIFMRYPKCISFGWCILVKTAFFLTGGFLKRHD